MLQIPDPQRNELESALQQIAAGAIPSDLESETLDFKEEVGSRDNTGQRQVVPPKNEAAANDLANAAVCFANSRGGVLVIGVDDASAGSDAVVGCSIDLAFLRQRIWEITNPNLTVAVEEREFLNQRLCIVYVHEGFELHRAGRRMPHRVGATCQPMNPQDQQRILEERRGYDWSSAKTPLGVEAANVSALEAVRRMLLDSGEPSREELAQQSDAELIRRLGLSADGCLNRAGALLLVGSEYDPSITFVKRDAPGADSRVREDFAGPLIVSYVQLMRTVNTLNPTEHVPAPAGVTRQVQRLPERAVREAIVNALIHRDWRLPDPVDVEMVGDQLTVNSPGGFMPGIDPTNLLSHPSKPRNRCLTSAMRSLRLAEREGVGVDRMYREMIRSGHQPPDIRDAGGRVRCVLIGGKPDAAVLSITTALDPAIRDDVDALLAIHTLLTQPTIAAGELAPLIQKTEVEAVAALERTANARILTATNRTSLGRREYRLSDDVRKTLRTRLTYHSTSADEAETTIIQYVVEHGEVRNQDVTHLLGVKTVQASRVLRSLREAGVLESGSEHQSGPGVYYISGEQFNNRAAAFGILIPENSDPAETIDEVSAEVPVHDNADNEPPKATDTLF